jgi:hypothetical protein
MLYVEIFPADLDVIQRKLVHALTWKQQTKDSSVGKMIIWQALHDRENYFICLEKEGEDALC